VEHVGGSLEPVLRLVVEHVGGSLEPVLRLVVGQVGSVEPAFGCV